MIPDITIHLIYLRTGEMILSKKHYHSWHEIQEEYEDYMTDLFFTDYKDVIHFFEDDFVEESSFPFSRNEILNFAVSDKIIIMTNE